MSTPPAPAASGPEPGRREVTVGALLGLGARLWRRHFLAFTVTSAVVLAPSFAYWQVLAEHVEHPSLQTVTGVAVDMWLMFTLAAAMACIDRRDERGASARADDPPDPVTGTLRVLGTNLLGTVHVVVPMLLLVVPGLVRLAQLFVAAPAAAVEGRRGTDALSRSEQLTRGARWTLFGAWLAIRVAGGFAGWLTTFVLVTGSNRHAAALEGVNWLLELLSMAATSTTMVAGHILLRARHGLPDARTLAAVFD